VITQKLADALILLRNKRTTLEDKAIAKVFLDLVSSFAETSQMLCRLYEEIETRVNHSTNSKEALSKLSEFSSSIEVLVEDCLKSLEHNYNYFEQYYEYDFVAMLKDLDVQAHLADLNSQIASCLIARKGAPDESSPLTNLP
jgi:uncharacterized protein YydD (DUF2326 family)